MSKYLLIDGNNLGIRNAFANEQLSTSNGMFSGAIFGTLSSLLSLKKNFLDYEFLIAWDGKSARRREEARLGVEKGIIPSGYKENRPKGEDMPETLKKFYDQLTTLKIGIDTLGIAQIRLADFEADDVIASYVKKLKEGNEIVLVTSDEDYYQLLDYNVKIWDGMKNIEITKESWEKDSGISVEQVVDLGAICGDTGDNIFGLPGWGDKTTIKELKNFKTYKDIIKSFEEELSEFRQQYPECSEETIKELSKIKSNPDNENSRLKYPGVYSGSGWGGVLEAFENKKVKIQKNKLIALLFQDRLDLAYSLKKMDFIEGLPSIPNIPFKEDKLNEFLDFFEIYSLEDLDIFKK
jgi:DNA polymerase I